MEHVSGRWSIRTQIFLFPQYSASPEQEEFQILEFQEWKD